MHELFNHSILKGASDIRFASAIPGLNQIIAIYPLLRGAIVAAEAGGDVEGMDGVRAIRAIGVLDNDHWHAHARVVAASAEAVISPMFSFLMKHGAYNAAELAKGEWKKWAAAALEFIDADSNLKPNTVKGLEPWLGALAPEERDLVMACGGKHMKRLADSISSRFGAMWNRIDFIPCALLARDTSDEKEWAGKLLETTDALSLNEQSLHSKLVQFVTTHREQISLVSSGACTVKGQVALHAALIAEYRFRTDMLNQERVFSTVTHFTASAHAAKAHRISLVTRQKKNKTEVSAEEFRKFWPEVKAMLRAGSSFKALFIDPDWEGAWTAKFPDPRRIPMSKSDYSVIEKYKQVAELDKKMEIFERSKRSTSKKKRKNKDKECDTDKGFEKNCDIEKADARGEKVSCPLEPCNYTATQLAYDEPHQCQGSPS